MASHLDPFDDAASWAPADSSSADAFDGPAIPTPAVSPDDDDAYWASLLDDPASLPDASDDTPDVLPPRGAADGRDADVESEECGPDPTWVAARPRPRSHSGVITSAQLQQQVRTQARRMLASCQDRPPEALTRAVDDVLGAVDLVAALEPAEQSTLTGVCEVLTLLAASMAADNGALIDLRHTPHQSAYSAQVREELAAVRRLALAGDGQHLASAATDWSALIEMGARIASIHDTTAYLKALRAHAPAEELVALHATLSRPTRAPITTEGRAEAMTASEWEVHLAAQEMAAPARRFSCGLRTADVALTNAAAGEDLGAFTQGTFTVIAAGSGEGKSSFAGTIVPAMARDMRNQGLTGARIILAHTEESPAVKLAQMGLRRGQRNHDLADNTVVAPVMSDRRMLARVIYQQYARAIKESQSLGISPALLAPQVVVVDYIQQLKDAGEDDTKAVARSADFLLNGVANGNPDEMAKFSGEDFTTVTGMRWSDDLDGHRLAVVAFAQLIKFDESTLRYVPGSRNTPLEKFVIFDDAGNPCWEVQPGDRRIPDKSEIRGSGVLVQHAHNIIMLSRSRADDNPVIRDADGRSRLMDTRARLILSKTRDGASMPYLPMAFDSSPSGLKGQYYDVLAEQAINMGVFTPDPSWAGPGDAILPSRKSADPFAGVRY